MAAQNPQAATEKTRSEYPNHPPNSTAAASTSRGETAVESPDMTGSIVRRSTSGTVEDQDEMESLVATASGVAASASSSTNDHVLAKPPTPTKDRLLNGNEDDSTGVAGKSNTLTPFDIGESNDDGTVSTKVLEHEYDIERSMAPWWWRWTPLATCANLTWGQFYDWMYPPAMPRPTQLMRKENLAIPCCYLVVGLLQGLSGPFINVYPLDLNATEAQQTTLSGIRSLPASFKLVFGFLSDNVPLAGYRRKSYMFVGWLVTSISMLNLLLFSDLSPITKVEQEVSNDEDGARLLEEDGNEGGSDGEDSVIPDNAPSVPFLSASILLFGTGFWFADVMGDSLVAEKAKLEPEETRGHLQSTCYACRFFGVMIAAPISTVLYSAVGPRIVVALMAIIPLLILPFVWWLWEARNMPVARTDDQCREIWNTVCSRAVWQPMGFVFLYNLLQIPNAAWREFLRTYLGFTQNQLNSLLIVSYVLLYLGVLTYKYFFLSWSWRVIYIVTTLLGGLLSAMQLLLIEGITFGLSPFVFALGDDAFAEFIAGIQFLPTTIMMVHLCPSGSEGASYAMFTTVNNVALSFSSAISTLLLPIWDVDKETFQAGDVSGMKNLTILTTLLQMSGVLFVGWLPRTKTDLMKLNEDPASGSIVGGGIFLVITFLALLYSVVIGVLNIISPGWAGES